MRTIDFPCKVRLVTPTLIFQMIGRLLSVLLHLAVLDSRYEPQYPTQSQAALKRPDDLLNTV